MKVAITSHLHLRLTVGHWAQCLVVNPLLNAILTLVRMLNGSISCFSDGETEAEG